MTEMPKITVSITSDPGLSPRQRLEMNAAINESIQSSAVHIAAAVVAAQKDYMRRKPLKKL